MRILQVCPYDLAHPGGVQRHVLDLAAALVRAGHEVTVFAPGLPAEPGAWDGLGGLRLVKLGAFRRVGVLGTAFELSLARGAEVDAALAAAAPDLVHFHTLWTPLMSWQVWGRLDALPAVARVATFHDTPPDGWGGNVMRAIFGLASARLSRKLQAAIPVSAAPARHLRLQPSCRQYILPACIDLAPYRALPRADAPREGCVLFVGRLEPRKGVLTLLRAWEAVQAARPDARLVVCGDGPERAQAEVLVRAQGLGASVSFAGRVDEDAKRAWMARAGLFCAPSLYGESYGLVLAEAMAAGLPVVAAANAGYAQVLDGAGAAGLVPPGDVAALSARLIEWLGDAALRARMAGWGDGAWARADVASQLPVFEAIYADAVRSKREGTGQLSSR